VAVRAEAQNDRESEIPSDGRGNDAWKSLPEMMHTISVFPADFKVLRLDGKVPLHGYGGRRSTAMAGCIPLYLHLQAEGRQPGLTSAS
jgi:hypothetical protein